MPLVAGILATAESEGDAVAFCSTLPCYFGASEVEAALPPERLGQTDGPPIIIREYFWAKALGPVGSARSAGAGAGNMGCGCS